MEKPLLGSADADLASEILSQNILTPSYLRSLLAGNFDLEPLRDGFLLFHEKGIFVLKQCHCNGMIYGSIRGESWTDMNYLGQGTAFPNPLTRAAETVDFLVSVLKLPREAFHSLILFDTQCELRSVPRSDERFTLLRVDELEAFFAKLPRLPLCYTYTQLEALKDIFLLVYGEK